MADEPTSTPTTTYTQDELDAALEDERRKLVANRDKALDQAKRSKAALAERDAELDELRESVRTLEQRAKAAEAGVADDKLQQLREQIEADERRKWAAVADERDALKGQLTDALGQVRALQLDNVVKTDMARAGARADRIDALFTLTQGRYELTDDGEVVASDHRDVPLVKYLQTEVASEYPEFWQGSGSSGGGAARSAGGAGGSKRFIPAGDTHAFMQNLEGIASGEVEVRGE